MTPAELAETLKGLAQEQRDLADALSLRGAQMAEDAGEREIRLLLERRAEALDQVIEETGLGSL